MAAYFQINELYNTNAKAEIINLGIKYQLATKYTSFVAVAENDSATNDALQKQQISLLTAPLPTLLPTTTTTTTKKFSMHSVISAGAATRSGGGGGMRPVMAGPSSSTLSWETTYDAGKYASPKSSSTDGFRVTGDVAGPTSSHKAYKASDDDEKYTGTSSSFGFISSPQSSHPVYSPPDSSSFGGFQPTQLSSPPPTFWSAQPVPSMASPPPQPFSTPASPPQPVSTPASPPQPVSTPASPPQPVSTPASPQQPVFPLASPQPSLSSEFIKTKIVSSQQFDGCWDEPALQAILSHNTKAALDANPKCNEKIWLTVLAIALLESKCQSSKTAWEIVSNKAKTFMSKYLFTQEKMDKEKIAPFIEALISQAQEVLRKLNV